MVRYLIICLHLFYYQQLAGQSLSLIAHLPYPDIAMSSIWGYTAPNGKEYVLAGTGKGLSIVDISNPLNPVEVQSVNGSPGVWREIKTWKNFAYISHDNSNDNEGILIVDLQFLPDSVKVLDFKGEDGNLRRAHTLFVDSAGFLYLFGGTYGVCSIYDLNINPQSPKFIGKTSGNYIHDGFVRGDTLWAADIYKGLLSVWNIKNRTSPELIAQFNTPYNFTHNAWLSDNSQYLFTTDETEGSAVAAFNVSNIFDIELVDQFKLSAEETSIPHNVHVLNDFLILSHYTEGVVIADAKIPEKIIKIAAYDTSPDYSGKGFNGCWGVYPYFPSGIIAATDIEKGLYLLQPEYKKAARIFGTVKDEVTGEILKNVSVYNDESLLTNTDFDGQFKTGFSPAGNTNLRFSINGYNDTIFSILLNEGDFIDTVIYMKKNELNTATINPSLIDIKVNIQNDILKASNLPLNSEYFTLQIFSSTGQLMLEKSIFNNSSIELDVKMYPSGLYIVQIFNKTERISTKVFKN